jgi:hypothetical protein
MAFRRVLLLVLLVLTAVVPDAHALTVRTNPFTLGQAPGRDTRTVIARLR